MIMCPHTLLLQPPYSSYISHSLPFMTSAHHHVPPQTSYESGIGFYQTRYNHPQILLHGSLNIEEPPPTPPTPNIIRVGYRVYPTQYQASTRCFSFSLNHVQILYCYYSIYLDSHLRRLLLLLPFSAPTTAAAKTTTHIFSFSLHQLYFHLFHCSTSFSILRCFHVIAAADPYTLRLLRSHCPTSITDQIPRWLIRRHKLKPQNRSSLHQVYQRILASTPPLGVAEVAVKNGGRILDGAVVKEVSAVLVVTVLGHTLSSPPSLSITLLYCFQQEKIDATGVVLCCGSTDELAPAGNQNYGRGIILIISMKKRDQMMKGDVLCCGGTTEELAQEGQHGPGMIVISMKNRAVAYTDFWHPKAMRKLEVWSMYGFMICCCSQSSECELQPFTYLDHSLLQEFGAVSCASSSTCSHRKVFIDMALRRLSTWVNYLSVGDPKSGEKLEKMLISV